MLVAIIIVGIVLATAGSIKLGRLAGLGITATYGATIAFFLMPPFFSLRVSQPRDLVALTFYGAAGLVLSNTAPSKKRRATLRRGPTIEPEFSGSPPPETDLSLVVRELMSSEVGGTLKAVDFKISGESLGLPCSDREILCILTDVLTQAAENSEIQRILLSCTRLPSERRLTIAAHYVWPPPEGRVVVIGQGNEASAPVRLPHLPANARVTWFDNGCSWVWQISMATGGRSRVTSSEEVPSPRPRIPT